MIALLASRYVRIGMAVAGAMLLLLLAVKCVRDDGAADERRRAAAAQRIEDDNQRAREREADVTRQMDAAAERSAAERRTKEIDNVSRNIPDQKPSDRQRVRVELELRRQAEANRRDPAAR